MEAFRCIAAGVLAVAAGVAAWSWAPARDEERLDFDVRVRPLAAPVATAHGPMQLGVLMCDSFGQRVAQMPVLVRTSDRTIVAAGRRETAPGAAVQGDCPHARRCVAHEVHGWSWSAGLARFEPRAAPGAGVAMTDGSTLCDALLTERVPAATWRTGAPRPQVWADRRVLHDVVRALWPTWLSGGLWLAGRRRRSWPLALAAVLATLPAFALLASALLAERLILDVAFGFTVLVLGAAWTLARTWPERSPRPRLWSD